MRRLVVLALALELLAGRAEAAAPELPEATLAAVRQVHASGASFGERLGAISRLLVGRPFRRSPLGEGAGRAPDADPTMDLRHFDCLTFVEQVIALAWHADAEAARAALQRIRYRDGEIRYGARNHIMMAHWIPANEAAGIVRDITRAIGADAAVDAVLDVAEHDFDRGLGQRLHLAPADRPVGRFVLPILPLRTASTWLDRVPDGTVLTTIRAARAGVPYRASHVGLVVVVDGARRIRHAHARVGAVVEEPLGRFVERCRRSRQPPVTGFNLLAVAASPPPGG